MVRGFLGRMPAPRDGAGRGTTRRLLALALSCLAMAVQAADLQVNPILVEFAPGEQSQALWLTNTGTETLKAQVRVSRWTQHDGQDQHTPSRDLIPSPAILDVPAGEQQLVRLIRAAQATSDTESAYRLTVDELPRERAAGQSPGLQFLMRYSIPAFVLATGTVPLSPSRQTGSEPIPASPVVARLLAGPSGSELEVGNSGRQRVKLSGLAWVDAAGTRTELVPGLVGYVLAGERMRWPIPLSAQAQSRGGSLRVRLNDDQSERTLALDGTGG